jgi:hypothetical protein
VAQLKNHPGLWLRDDAAAAINALEDKYGKIVINSAGRTVGEQQNLINRWDRGGAANRPPHLYEPARPASSSNHVSDGGIAIDVYNFTDDRAKLNEFGFEWYGTSDPVHYTFVGKKPKPTPQTQWNPFGISYCAGLQKIANLYGGGTAIDQIWGAKSAKGFAQFLRRNWGYSGNDVLGPVMWAAIARWLRARWGYVGNDVPGPVMRAALQRAETANFHEL